MKHPIGRSLVFLAFVCLVWQTGDLFAQNQAVSSVNISDALTHSDEEFDVLLKSFPREKLPGVWKSLDVAGRKAYFDGDYRKADQFHQKARLVALSLSDMLRFGKSSHQLGLAFVRQNKRNGKYTNNTCNSG